MTQRIERDIVKALGSVEPPIAPGQVKEVVANLRHSISGPEDLRSNLEAILDERARLWKIAKGAYNPSDWFSSNELESMPECKGEAPPDCVEQKIVQRAIEHFYRRDGWEILLAINLDEEGTIVPALSETGYDTMTVGSPEMAIKRIGEKRGHNVIVVTDYSASDAVAMREKIRESYPTVPFLVISKRSKADESGPILVAKDLPYVLSEPLNRDELIIRLDQMAEEITKKYPHKAPLMPREKEAGSANNHVCVLMGPTCAGKSEISSRLRKRMAGVALARKSVTRRRRHAGEEDVEPYTLFRDPEQYFLRWEKGGVKAGLRYTIFDPFEQGDDLIISVSELGVLQELVGHIEKNYPGRNVVVPVAIMSENDEIWARFTKRGFGPDEDTEQRRRAMGLEIGSYMENMHKFLSVIFNNSSYHTEEELAEDAKVGDLNVVVNRVQRLLKRLREVPLEGYRFPEYHQKFVDDAVRSLWGYETFDDLLRAQRGMGGRMQLEFSEEERRQFVDDRQFPVEYLEYGDERKVVALKSNGRAVIVVDAYGNRKNGVDPDTEFFTGLIERKVGRPWQKQDTSTESAETTPYGLVKCADAVFRGGVHFAITDRFPFNTDENLYALDIVYMRGGESLSSVSPISKEEQEAMRKKAVDDLNKSRKDAELL